MFVIFSWIEQRGELTIKESFQNELGSNPKNLSKLMIFFRKISRIFFFISSAEAYLNSQTSLLTETFQLGLTLI